MNEKKKFALVTGGSRGIGRAICIQLDKDSDYTILINYQGNRSAALETLNEIEKTGGSGELLQFNVADTLDVRTKLDAWHDANKEAIIEVIINNAGITRD